MGLLTTQMMPSLSGPDFYAPSRLSPPSSSLLAPSDLVTDVPHSSCDKIPPLVPVPLPWPPTTGPYCFLPSVQPTPDPLYPAGQRDYAPPDELYVPLRTVSPAEHGVFKPYPGSVYTEDSKSRLIGEFTSSQKLTSCQNLDSKIVFK